MLKVDLNAPATEFDRCGFITLDTKGELTQVPFFPATEFTNAKAFFNSDLFKSPVMRDLTNFEVEITFAEVEQTGQACLRSEVVSFANLLAMSSGMLSMMAVVL